MVQRGAVQETVLSWYQNIQGPAAGLWPAREALADCWSEDHGFEPTHDEPHRQALYQGWKEAGQRLTAP